MIPDRISGLPSHPLIVHAAVVLMPLLVLGAIGYGLVPWVRQRFRWPVGLLALVGPIACYASKVSGQAFKTNKNNQSPKLQQLISVHQGYANKTFLFALALGVVTLAMVFLVRPAVRTATAVSPRVGATVGGGGDPSSYDEPEKPAAAVLTGPPMVMQIAFAAVATALALVSAYYIYKTGDSGAHMAWGGY